MIYLPQLVFKSSPFAQSTNLRLLSSELTHIYFIGDLHGDDKCAKSWVRRTNLINITSIPYQWTGNLDTDAIVFLGDYVDKGPMSRAVIEFVRQLQETFPDNVVAMLGNHDFTNLYDLALSRFHEEASTFPSYDSVRHNTHPEDYLNSGWSPHRSDDVDIIVAIHKALQNVYKQSQKLVYMCAPPLSNCKSYHVDLFTEFSPFNSDFYLAERVRHRIMQWRNEYSNGMAKSGLLSWLGSRPTIAIIGDALVAHGGISPLVMQAAFGHASVNNLTLSVALNEVSNKRFHEFWEQQSPQIQDTGYSITAPLPDNSAFDLVDDLLEYRGYFDDEREVGWQQCKGVNDVLQHFDDLLEYRGYFDDEREVGWQQCEGVNDVLQHFDEVNRIVIGHTPDSEATEYCNGTLLNTDSKLSRFFRAYNAEHCPHGENIRQTMKEENSLLTASCKNDLPAQCEGTISSISRSSPSDPWLTKSKHIRMGKESPSSTLKME